MSEKVVFLAYKGSNVTEEHMTVDACANCRNKTFLVIYDGQNFPLMKCAACGQHIGRIGFADEGE